LIGFDGNKKVKGSKIHALVTVDSLPLSIQLGRANEHDSRKVIPLLENLELRRKPEELYGDMAYDTFIVRWYLGTKRIKARIPKRSKKKTPGRPPPFDKESYKKNRSKVERFFSWIKNFRKILVRFERHESTFFGLVRMAWFLISWKVLK
jgi:transposase